MEGQVNLHVPIIGTFRIDARVDSMDHKDNTFTQGFSIFHYHSIYAESHYHCDYLANLVCEGNPVHSTYSMYECVCMYVQDARSRLGLGVFFTVRLWDMAWAVYTCVYK